MYSIDKSPLGTQHRKITSYLNPCAIGAVCDFDWISTK